AQLSQIQVEVGVDLWRDKLVAREWDVAETLGGITGGVDRVVLDATAGSDLGVACLDEGGQCARQSQSTTGKRLFREKHAVQKGVHIKGEQHLGQLSQIHEALIHIGQLGFQFVEDGFVFSFEDVGR